jgi:hypothetical protein
MCTVSCARKRIFDSGLLFPLPPLRPLSLFRHNQRPQRQYCPEPLPKRRCLPNALVTRKNDSSKQAHRYGRDEKSPVLLVRGERVVQAHGYGGECVTLHGGEGGGGEGEGCQAGFWGEEGREERVKAGGEGGEAEEVDC